MAIGANLARRDQLLVAASVLAVAIAGVYGYFLYLPKSGDLAAIQQHVEVLDKKNNEARAAVASGSLQRLRMEASQYGAELVVLRQVVPTTNEVPALLENVSTAARRVGLDLSSVEPMPVLMGEQFDTYRYKLSVTGGYHAIAAFLANVGSLNRIIAPVALLLKPLAPQEKNEIRVQKKDESLLDTDFQIQTYIAHTADQASAPAEESKRWKPVRVAAGGRVISRETYSYQGTGRRDPFVSLMNTEELRPLFQDLKLVAVAFDATGRNSVAVLRDVTSREQYRVKVGQEIGRMRVASIAEKSVVFGIEEFGYSRRETLAMNDSTKVRTQ